MLDANGRLDLQVTGCCLRSPYSETIFQKRFLVIWRSLAELVEALLKLRLLRTSTFISTVVIPPFELILTGVTKC